MSRTYEWSWMYEAIREANIALMNLPDATFTDETLKEQLIGEARFLRAYYYHQLLRFYGGFPIIEQVYGLNEDYTIERNTFEECVNFIVSELDQAANELEGKSPEAGRANRLAALALKARVLLYAASDLHDIPTASAAVPTIASYAQKELLGYASGDRNARWLAAKNAAKVVVDETTGYKLDLSAPVSAAQGRENYVA